MVQLTTLRHVVQIDSIEMAESGCCGFKAKAAFCVHRQLLRPACIGPALDHELAVGTDQPSGRCNAAWHAKSQHLNTIDFRLAIKQAVVCTVKPAGSLPALPRSD